MASQTMLAGMKFSITGTPNSHDVLIFAFKIVKKCISPFLSFSMYASYSMIHVNFCKIVPESIEQTAIENDRALFFCNVIVECQ